MLDIVKAYVASQSAEIDDLVSRIDLRQTCGVCPEQYDAFLDGRQVGFLHLRHGEFKVFVPDASGEIAYRAHPKGDGIFEDDERDHYLHDAKVIMALADISRSLT